MKLTTQPNLNVILADDDPDYHHLFREVLIDAINEATLVTMENGEELMAYLGGEEARLPGIIFLDINMPRKNGKQCLFDIRQDKKLLNIPVVMFSTSNYYQDINETYDMGANLYVTKFDFFNNPVTILKEIFNLNWNEYFPKPPREKFVVRH